MKWGVCCSSRALGEVSALVAAVAEAGFDYIELGAAEVREERAFETLRAQLAGAALQPEAWNSFVPAEHRITGPDVNMSALLDYCETTLQRCAALGGRVMVLGSGGARRVAEGFDPAEAHQQFVAFCRELAPLAQNAGMVVCIEPLNRREDNLINSLAAGAAVVEAVNHPALQLLADLYHMTEDGEPTSEVARYAPHLRHTHGADLGRVVPGFAPEGEGDFVGFLGALHQAGYQGRFSFEGRWDDLPAQLRPLLAFLRQRWNEVALPKTP